MQIDKTVGPIHSADGNSPGAIRVGRTGAQIVSDAHGRYSEASRRGNLFVAYATVTAPVIFSTAAGTGGPLLWNGSTDKTCSVLAIGVAVPTVSTVAGALGLTGGSNQTAAPGSTTAIDGRANMLMGGGASASTPYRVGTVSVAGTWFLPLLDFATGALTTTPGYLTWCDVGGLVTVPPNAWVSVAGSATLSTLVAGIAMVYEEFPV